MVEGVVTFLRRGSWILVFVAVCFILKGDELKLAVLVVTVEVDGEVEWLVGEC